MISALFRPKPEKTAGHFFLILIIQGVFSIVIILFLAMYGLGKTISHQLYLNAEHDAIHVSQAILNLEMAAIIKESSPGIRQVRIAEADLAAFDQSMRKFLSLFDIIKIKIYNDNHRVVYSTDHAIIGMLDKDNRRLARALAGFNDSSLKRKETTRDLAMEEKFDLDVVETYTPISIENGPVIGAFEIYKDITRDRQTIISLGRKNVAILAAVLLLVFTPSMLIVRSLTKKLSLAQDKLKQQASIDFLTGVLSRSEVLARARDRIFRPNRRKNDAPEHAGSAGIIMLDIDHFKSINDKYGHLVGDCILKSLAQRIVTVLRRGDIFGRFGGEEFLVVLPESSLATTRDLGQRIRRIIADTPFDCEGSRLSVSLSAGIACFTGNNEQEFYLALEEADKALYLAKEQGRNQVRCCGLNTDGGQL